MLTDQSIMPYGVHKGKKMEDVPAKYLIWLHDNDKCSSEVKAYIVDCMDILKKQEAEENKKPKKTHHG
jgi:uncharacterized protein (DUF3820 family)